MVSLYMKQLQEASAQLMEQLVFALNHSMDLKKNGVDPMIPFAIVVNGDDKTIKTFIGDADDYGDQRFEATIKEENPDFVVYASDSYITSNGIKYDAVLLKAYDKNDSEIYLVGQKFKPKTESEEYEQIGNPGHLGTIPNSFGSDKSSKPDADRQQKPWWKIW